MSTQSTRLAHGFRRAAAVASALLLCSAIAFAGQPDAAPPAGSASTLEERLAAMEKLLADQAARMRELEERLSKQEVAGPALTAAESQQPEKSPLDKAVEALQEKETPLDKALRELGPRDTAPAPSPAARGGPTLRLIDISVNLLTAAGSSSEREEELQLLQGGGHDPHKRGFTLQNLELSLAGAIDPYFRGETHIIYFIDPEGETVVELEEAYFETLSLPCGYQLRGGQFFTEFGRINANHPHVWLWQDQPIINTRLFGPDGLRAPGFRVSKLLNHFPWFSQVYFGMHNANGETVTSFLASEEFFAERPIGGRPFVERDVRSFDDLLYFVRWEHSWNSHCDEVTTLLGFSALYGPNATGPSGNTVIYGADIKAKWVPENNERGWPFLTFESEVMARHYRADEFFSEGDDPLDPADDIFLDDDTLFDWGFYAQVLWGFKYQWAMGLRYEFAGGNRDSVFAFDGRQSDPFRDDRHRISPMLVWYPSEFSRIRLQYNFDHAEHLDGDAAHAVWLGFEGTYGVHPPHKF